MSFSERKENSATKLQHQLILLRHEFQWADWRPCPGESTTLWAPVSWGRWMNQWFSLNCRHKGQSQAPQKQLLFLFLLTSSGSCSQVSSASCQTAVLVSPFLNFRSSKITLWWRFSSVCFYRAQTGPGYDEWTAVRTNDADWRSPLLYLHVVQSHFFSHFKDHVNGSFLIWTDWYLVVFFLPHYKNNNWWKCFQTGWFVTETTIFFCKILYIN